MKKMEVIGTTVSSGIKSLAIIFIATFSLAVFSHEAAAQSRASQMPPSASASRPRRVTAELIAVNTRAAAVPANVSNEMDVAAQLEQRIFQLINETRVRHGLNSLSWDPDLCRMARSHSTNMGLNTFFAHKNLDGKGPKERAVQAGIRSFRRIGENIAYNWGNEDPAVFAVERWMLSEGHRENILGKGYNASAIGVFVKPNGAVYITQEFISR
jgi:uncharacterized protein YkwD